MPVRVAHPDSSVAEQALELIVFWQNEIRVFPLPAAGTVSIGRSEENQIRIDTPSVSRRHALLQLGTRPMIEDLGGTNGTFIQRKRTTISPETLGLRQLSGEAAEISVGEHATLGGVTIVLRRAVPPPSKPGANDGDAVVVQDPAMQRVFEQAKLAARSPISILIMGETGVGKEVLARAIHEWSPRTARPFMGINCAALSGTLLEGELFGYEKGAFTGAVQARPGLFEAAEGGTVFLDELAELPVATQAKLLRLIEERSVMRLGSRVSRPIDVRFVSATNRDPEREILGSNFRADLFYRLGGMSIHIPPLRERRLDIEPLAELYVQRACRQLDRANVPGLSRAAIAALTACAWPGNVRELKNVIERAVVLCAEGEIGLDHLPPGILAKTGPPVSPAETASGPAAPLMRDELRGLERARIIEALAQCLGNQTEAAKMLGISRRTLVSRLAEFNLPRPRKRDPSEG